jgi:hypothetical protein
VRVLTVRQPWAWAIVYGGKDVENRIRNVAGAYRGPIAIHAGLSYDNEASWSAGWESLHAAITAEGSPPWDAPWVGGGAIIGVVDLVAVHDPLDPLFSTTVAAAATRCSPWAEPNAFHLVLANPRPLLDPIPFRGALGLRELDPATTARVLEALAA